jgi:hypothetical protein
LLARFRGTSMQNITTQFLGSLSANQFNTIYRTVAQSLPSSQRDFCTDWVNETITSWCVNDSFANHLSKGKKLTVPFLINFIKSRNITIREKWGKDALNRNLGMRTKDERRVYTLEEQIARCSVSPTDIAYQLDDETEEQVDFMVSDTTFEDKADIQREIADVKAYVIANCHSSFNSVISKVLDLYFLDYSNSEIADILGLPSTRHARDVLAEIRRVATMGREKGDL